MIMVNIADAKAKLSEFVDAASRGEQVIICHHNKPVAELRAIEAPRTAPRDLTPLHPEQTFMTDAFFEPMTDAELEGWYGPGNLAARVAERPSAYGKSSGTRRQRKPRS